MKTRTTFVFITAILLCVCGTTTSLLAQAPNLLNYQGKILKGGIAESRSFSITFSIYSSLSGGSALWTETQTVMVSRGVFNVLLGSTTPFPNNLFNGTGDRYLGIKVETDPEIVPRFRLTSSAFAIRATKADSVVDGSVIATKLANNAVTNAKIAASAVDSTKLASNAVTSGKIATGTINNSDLANNAVTSAKIQDNTITVSDVLPNILSSLNGISNDGGNINLEAGSNIAITPDSLRKSIRITAVVTGTGEGDITAVNAGNGLIGDTPAGDATLNVVAGTGLRTFPDSLALNLGFTDGHYVNEGQANAITGAMIQDGTITTTDIAANANIPENKLQLNNPTHPNTNDPTVGEKAALAGTSGTPSSTNKYVTDNDARNTNPRTPIGTASGDLTGTYPNPTIANNAVTSAKIADGSIGNSDLSDGAVTQAKLASTVFLPPGGPAGGDLAGSTYPNPTIAANTINSSKIADGTIQPADLSFTAGDITDVIAGAGLFGGGTSGSVSLSVANGGITSTMIQDGTITNADIAPTAAILESKLQLNNPTHSNLSDPTAAEKAALAGTNSAPSGTNRYVTDSDPRNTNSRTPSGAASGDLSGNYPGPTVAKLQTRNVSNTAPTNGQVLKWDGAGAQWKPDTDISGGGGPPTGPASGDLSGNYPGPTVVKLQTKNVSSTAPTTGQVLKWDGTQWKPDIDNSGFNLPFSGSTFTSSGTGAFEVFNAGTGDVIYAENTGTGDAISAKASSSGSAGYFDGSVSITGFLEKGSGSFKIDHPLDPANKYLYHSFVESPDMLNLYNGNTTLNANGEAWVELPAWFEALNKDFRYQLTAIGAPGPNLYIAQKIANNRFKIAGGTSGMEVSWQVTGVRHDAFAEAHRIQVEVEKTGKARGKYIHPKEHGMPETMGVKNTRNASRGVR